ncbi:MAG: hypothetical protein AAGC55_17495 [Myxococcota bacterium]
MAILTGEDLAAEPVARAIADLGIDLLLVPALVCDHRPLQALARTLAHRSRAVTLIANAQVPAQTDDRAAGADMSAPGAGARAVVIGMPPGAGPVIAERCPPGTLLVATLGEPGRPPEFIRPDAT